MHKINELNLAQHEIKRIRESVDKLNINDGGWSIRHLEGMQSVIEEEIRRRYGTE